MGSWFTLSWWRALWRKLPVVTSPKLVALQAAMLTGAFAMGAGTMAALQRSTGEAQAALNSTSGQDGAIQAIQAVGTANQEARASLHAASHPDQPIEHRATYAILDYSASEGQPAEAREALARERREVLRALYRTYQHERLQLEALQPRDEAQRELIAMRLSELPDAEASLREILGDDTPLDVPDTEPARPTTGIAQALGGAPGPASVPQARPSPAPAAEPAAAETGGEVSQRFDRALGE